MITLLKHPQAPLQGAALDAYLLKHVNGLKGELVVTGPGRTMGFHVPHSPNHHSQGTFFFLSLSGKKIMHKHCPGQWEVGDEGDRGPVFVRPRGHPQGGQTGGGQGGSERAEVIPGGFRLSLKSLRAVRFLCPCFCQLPGCVSSPRGQRVQRDSHPRAGRG